MRCYIKITISPTTRIEYPTTRIPNSCSSQKPSSAAISETESGIKDPLVSKRPKKILKKNITFCLKKKTINKVFGFLCDFFGISLIQGVFFTGTP